MVCGSIPGSVKLDIVAKGVFTSLGKRFMTLDMTNVSSNLEEYSQESRQYFDNKFTAVFATVSFLYLCNEAGSSENIRRARTNSLQERGHSWVHSIRASKNIILHFCTSCASILSAFNHAY